MTAARVRRGATLLELTCTVAIMAIMAGVVTIAARRLGAPAADDPRVRIELARRTALAEGHAISITILLRDTLRRATAFADGSVVADTSLPIETLTGAWRDSTLQ